MKGFIKRKSTGRKVLPLFILTNIIYIVMLAITIPHVMAFAGGMKLPDMMPMGYTAEYISGLMDALGESGRQAYLYRQIPLDMLYPGLFAITYCLLLGYLLDKLGQFDRLYVFCLLPVLAGLFDYAENIGVISLLTAYPSAPFIPVALTNAFTITKSLLSSVYFVILIITLVAAGWKFANRRLKA